MGSEFSSRQGLNVFLEAVEGGRDKLADAQFEYSPTGWVIQIRKAVLQAVVSAGLLAGILAMAGADQLPAAVISGAIPFLIAIDRVSLSEGDQYVLARLRASPEAIGSNQATRDLYARLPADVAAELPFHDFLDFLEACKRVGVINVHKDGSLEVSPADPGRLVIRFE
jgi:hypothetical protein